MTSAILEKETLWGQTKLYNFTQVIFSLNVFKETDEESGSSQRSKTPKASTENTSWKPRAFLRTYKSQGRWLSITKFLIQGGKVVLSVRPHYLVYNGNYHSKYSIRYQLIKESKLTHHIKSSAYIMCIVHCQILLSELDWQGRHREWTFSHNIDGGGVGLTWAADVCSTKVFSDRVSGGSGKTRNNYCRLISGC